MFAVVGSGFGLYGYFPALVEAFGAPVLLPEAYREKVAARPELQAYLPAVRWARDAEAAMAEASGVVVATPPARQAAIVSRCLEATSIADYVLEKPLARTPREAGELMGRLRANGRRFRIGYTLLHAAWAPRIALGSAPASITWTFMAHHFAHGLENWKRDHREGGGVLRFFGIHLLALLAREGYDEVADSMMEGETEAQPQRWSACFRAAGLAPCRVEVDSRAPESRFEIATGAGTSLALAEPFASEEPAAHGGDRRVRVLARLLGTLDEAGDASMYALYERANDLWRKVEASSRVVARAS